MLQIRLIKSPSSEGGNALAGNVTVACPDHLVLADLPVAKGIGGATAAPLVKSVGRRSRRQLGERVHFCVRCDFPISIYRRLSPCEHAFCLDCARSDSMCYLCDERIQKIQTIKIMEGIFVCAAPHCLKSFLKRTEFESHIHETHADLLHPNTEKDDGKEFGQFSDNQRGGLPETPFSEYPPMHSMPCPPGSVLGYPPGPAAGMNYPPPPYPQPWSDYGRNSGAMPLNPPPRAMEGTEPPAQPLQLQHQARQGHFYSGNVGGEAQQGFGWQHENHGGFGNS